MRQNHPLESSVKETYATESGYQLEVINNLNLWSR